MTVKLGSNISSRQAQRRLGEATSALSTIFERLSSGQRINRASDDAAGLAVSSNLNLNTRVYSQGIRNANDGLSLLSIADSALGNLTGVVTRIRELATQAANSSYSVSQRRALDEEAQTLSREFSRITRSTSFNGLNLFDGSLGSGVRMQVGFGEDGSIRAGVGGAIGNGTFSITNSFGVTGLSTQSIETADLNGDGILDLVVAGGGAGVSTIRVQLGRGDGTFSEGQSFTAGAVIAVALADVDNDGVLDLAQTSSGDVVIRRGNGDGTFGDASTFSTASEFAREVAFRDLNGDGVLDLVSNGRTGVGVSGELSVRFGTGNGSFGALQSYSAEAGGSSGLGLADLNGDGILDVVTGGGTSGAGGPRITVRLGNGDGTFRAAQSQLISATGQSAFALALGDLNGDGRIDLVTAVDGTGGRVMIQLGNGDGTFAAGVRYGPTTGASPYGLQLADLDGDQRLDIVLGVNTGFGGVTTLAGVGDGTFRAAVSYESGGVQGRGALALGDFNGDGVVDLIAGGINGTNVSVFTSQTREGRNDLLAFSLLTRADALQSLSFLDRAIANLSQQRGEIGTHQSRIGSALGSLAAGADAFHAAAGRILDADISGESAALIRTQILQQAASSVLAQANLQPGLALQLLRG